MEGGDRWVASAARDAHDRDREDLEGCGATRAARVIELVGIDHVQLSMPVGGEPEARRFYGTIFGLREVDKPPALAGRGGCWFAGEPGLAVQLATEVDFRPLAKAHPALVVRDLAAARAALSRAGVAIEEDVSGLPVRRCYVRDPFGNRIELVDASDAGFSER
jgi:catechol 2,3-dioxygenase-like lactoylglutathione lyase family enzyme